MANPRNAKLADQIKVILAETIERKIKDPRLGMVTLTDVRLTGDNREATVFYTVYGTEEDQANTAAGLESAKGLLRSTVGKNLQMKFTPTLDFVLDATPETARQIEDLLAKAQASDMEVSAKASGAQYAGEADPYRKPKDEDAGEES